jgi:acyl carrier protein
MDSTEIRAAVLETLKSIAPEMDAGGLKPDQPLRRQVDLDSMDWLNVIAGLHEKLQVDIPESDYGRLGTLDAIVTCVASNLDARDARPSIRWPLMRPGLRGPTNCWTGRLVCARSGRRMRNWSGPSGICRDSRYGDSGQHDELSPPS